MAARRLFTLLRVNTNTDAIYAPSGQGMSEHDARRHVAFCATDNLGMTRQDASKAAAALPLDGTPHRVGHYEFRAEPLTP